MTYRPQLIGLARSATSLASAKATPTHRAPKKKRVRPLPDALVAEIKRDLKQHSLQWVSWRYWGQATTRQLVAIRDEINYHDVKAAD